MNFGERIELDENDNFNPFLDGKNKYMVKAWSEGGFCGCGVSIQVQDAMIEALEKLENEEPYWTHWEDEEFIEKHKDLLPYLLFYMMDRMELLEHGGSLPGWLTDRGKQVLEEANQ